MHVCFLFFINLSHLFYKHQFTNASDLSKLRHLSKGDVSGHWCIIFNSVLEPLISPQGFAFLVPILSHCELCGEL